MPRNKHLEHQIKLHQVNSGLDRPVLVFTHPPSPWSSMVAEARLKKKSACSPSSPLLPFPFLSPKPLFPLVTWGSSKKQPKPKVLKSQTSSGTYMRDLFQHIFSCSEGGGEKGRECNLQCRQIKIRRNVDRGFHFDGVR